MHGWSTRAVIMMHSMELSGAVVVVVVVDAVFYTKAVGAKFLQNPFAPSSSSASWFDGDAEFFTYPLTY